MEAISIRPFIGSKNFEVSRSFYRSLGFAETAILPDFSVFQLDGLSFYLQDAYVEEWIKNTMLFIEIKNVEKWYEWLKHLELDKKYPGVELRPVKKEHWGEECFLIDPAGILIHFAQFYVHG
jgi:hypothetical protein